MSNSKKLKIEYTKGYKRGYETGYRTCMLDLKTIARAGENEDFFNLIIEELVKYYNLYPSIEQIALESLENDNNRKKDN